MPCKIGEGEASRVVRGEGLGKGGLEGRISNGISKAQRRQTPLCCAYVAYETTYHAVGFVDPSNYFLATTGRCKWEVGRTLA